jgi:hypothetical protein
VLTITGSEMKRGAQERVRRRFRRGSSARRRRAISGRHSSRSKRGRR